MGEARRRYERSIFASICLLGAIGVYERRQFGAHRLRSIMLLSRSSCYWYVGNEHSFSWWTMPFYINGTHILPIAQRRCVLGHYMHYGLVGALSTDIRQEGQ